jgi:phosphopantothenoylcysteine decarboxylase/phosphopantothenate--cysteine ligase
VTGGIAAYKAAPLARLLTGEGAAVTVVMTDAATRFVGADTFAALTGRPVHTSLWERPGDVVHVRLAHETDAAVIAPATANVIAKLALGLADDLLTSTLLEHEGPLVLAPAMHTGMWTAEATRRNVATLVERGARLAGPVDGALAHGDEGPGRMAEPEAIVEAVVEAVGAERPLAGRRILITAGPTHEPIDPVRFVGNRSSGRMGIAIADAALVSGAAVTLVLGPGTVDPPNGAEVIRITTADELRDAVLSRVGSADAVVMAAAVADFRPKVVADAKLKKEGGVPDVVFEPTPDILRELGERRSGQILVGFAAETGDVEAEGRRKLRSKGVDLLVANVVGRPDTGFGSDTNEAAILSAGGDDRPLRRTTKRALAVEICERIARLLDARP